MRLVRITGRVALLALFLSAFADPSQAQTSESNEQPTTIRGVVVNAVTRARIPRALVRSMDGRLAMLTDGDGQFEFTLPKSGAEGPIYADRAYFLQRGQRVHFVGDFALTAQKPGFFEEANGRREVRNSSGEITIALVPEALIKGKIALSTGDVASHITVQLYSRQLTEGYWRWLPGPTARANSAGEYRFAELQAGSYKMVTREWMDNDPQTTPPGGQLYGFPPVYYPNAADFSGGAIVEVAAGQTIEANVTLTRQPYYPVKIAVANGDPGGLNVFVEGQRGPGYSLGYDGREGQITGLLPNGNYVVEGNVFGPLRVSGRVSLSVNGAPAEGPAMTLVPLSSVSFDVKEEFNDAQPTPLTTWSDGKHTYNLRGPRALLSANVESADNLERPTGGAIRPPKGPDDDSLVIENVLPGKYWVRLYATHGYVASAMMGATDVLHEPVTIGSGATLPIEVLLRDDFAEIDGTVSNLRQQAGSPSNGAGAWIYFVPTGSSGQFQQFGASSDGRFANPVVVPGSYRVLTFENQQSELPYRDPVGMKAYETKGQVITVAPGQKTTMELQILSNAQ